MSQEISHHPHWAIRGANEGLPRIDERAQKTLELVINLMESAGLESDATQACEPGLLGPRDYCTRNCMLGIDGRNTGSTHHSFPMEEAASAVQRKST